MLKFTKEIDGYRVENKKEVLGYIAYDKEWKCNIFGPFGDTQYSSSCLKMIQTFMETTNVEDN